MDSTSAHKYAYRLFSERNYDELINFITPYVKDKHSWAEAIIGQCYKIGA